MEYEDVGAWGLGVRGVCVKSIGKAHRVGEVGTWLLLITVPAPAEAHHWKYLVDKAGPWGLSATICSKVSTFAFK